uniref:hypothetical protein n=1 Tax=Roseivirga sp. TaxID=1964215 RepID=UPI0040486666
MNLIELNVIELKSQESVEILGGGPIDWFSRKIFIWQNLWKLNKQIVDDLSGETDRQIMEALASDVNA